MFNLADARDMLRFRISKQYPFPMIPDTVTFRLKAKPEYNLRKIRKQKLRNLGAGAFMKGEVLRCMDGRILNWRHDTVDCFGLHGWRIHKPTAKARNRPSHTSEAAGVILNKPSRQQERNRYGREDIWNTDEFSRSNLPMMENDSRGPTLCLSLPDPNSIVTVENSYYLGGGGSHSGSDERLWANTIQDMQAADEMFNLFINSDECDLEYLR